MSDQPRDFLGFGTLWTGLRDGRAGFVPRLGLSIAGAVLAVSAALLMLGLIEASGQRIRDEQGFLALFLAAAGWLGLLIPVWRTYSRWRATLTTVVTCIIVVICTIAAGGMIGALVHRPEFLIASTSFLGAGAVLGIIASAIHRASRGRPMIGPRGQIDVRCPKCSYSLAGLDSTGCPECGYRCTIDQLILAQGYEGAKPSATPAEHPSSPSHAALAISGPA